MAYEKVGFSDLVTPLDAARFNHMEDGIVALDTSKQDKLTGKAGQVVGFDVNGNAVAQAAPESGGGTVEVDATLSVTGKAADAKAAGDAIKAEEAARKSEIDVERKRIDTFVSGGNASTEGNAELIDGRIGANGKTYPTIGDAIRTQVSTLDHSVGIANALLGVKWYYGFINTSGRFESASAAEGQRLCSDYILCPAGATVNFSGEFNNEYLWAIAFFDINKTFISGAREGTTGQDSAVVAPTGTVFARISKRNADAYWKFETDPASIPLSFVDFYNKIDYEKLSARASKNLFNKNDVYADSYLDGAGNVKTLNGYYVSGYIKVKPNTSYAIADTTTGGARLCCEYDANKAFIVAHTSGTNTFITRSNTKFVRITMDGIGKLDTQQLELGEESTKYEPFYEYYPVYKNEQDIAALKESVGVGESLRTVLPSTIYTVPNYQLPIYFENVLFKSLNDEGDIHFNDGVRTLQFQRLNFPAGAKRITATLNKHLKKIATQEFGVVTTDKTVNNGKTVTMLFVGDSFTDMGTYVTETKGLLEADGATVNLIGTCGSSAFKAEGLSGGTIGNTLLDASAGVARIVNVTGVTQAPNTGYPGRTYRDTNGNEWLVRGSKINSNGSGKIVVTKFQAKESDFATFPSSGTLTKVSAGGEGDATISYSSSTAAYYNPFIDPTTGAFSMSSYLNRWGFAAPDVVVLEFTFNDIAEWANDVTLQTVTNKFITAINGIHADLPNSKIIILVAPYGAIATRRDWNGKKYAVLKWVEQLKETFETDAYSNYVKIAPAYACVDLINGYGSAMSVPCSHRYPDVKEPTVDDGVHPSAGGMGQIADCLYPVVTYFNS